MKIIFLLPLPILFAFAFSHRTNSINAPPPSSDTCFYTIHVPPDIDMPSTPHFDTTIVRSKVCKVHILKLQSWGTETEYQLSGTSHGKPVSRSVHFSFNEGPGQIEITDLDTGNYSMSLLACGNGGGFTLRIR